MRKYILYFILFLNISCFKENKQYFTFINDKNKWQNYEIKNLMSSDYSILDKTLFGKEKNYQSFLYQDYFIFQAKKNYDKDSYIAKYEILNDKLDTLHIWGWIHENGIIELSKKKISFWILNNNKQFYSLNKEFTDNNKKLINIYFPKAEKRYFTISEVEQHEEISTETIKKADKIYGHDKQKRDNYIKLHTLNYQTIYVEIQMPKEKISFKFDKAQISFFGDEELYRKGILFIYKVGEIQNKEDYM